MICSVQKIVNIPRASKVTAHACEDAGQTILKEPRAKIVLTVNMVETVKITVLLIAKVTRAICLMGVV